MGISFIDFVYIFFNAQTMKEKNLIATELANKVFRGMNKLDIPWKQIYDSVIAGHESRDEEVRALKDEIEELKYEVMRHE